MPRNISFALTTDQFKARTKTVTRRMGWLRLRAGDTLCGVKKGMGLKPGEKVERLGMIRVVDARREPLRRLTDDETYGRSEMAREGFPDMEPSEFVEFFRKSHAGCVSSSDVTRIEYEFI